ncbi:MAG TPA: HAD-IA family hydrolase [Firmicutes bacterium]|nr:HAD-IA family hydrolase [Bacillota bacterium]
MSMSMPGSADPGRPHHTFSFKAVIYDFDYTLADSSAGVVHCANYALEQIGIPPFPPGRIQETIGLSLSGMLRHLIGEEADRLAAAFTKHFVSRADEVMTQMTRIYPFVPDVLRYINQAGMMQGIVSTKYRYRIETITAISGIREYFTLIVGGEDIKLPKPDPSGLQMAMSRLGVDPEAVLYVGDHLVDAEAAWRAGVSFAAVLTGTTGPAGLNKFPHISILRDVSQLPPLLGIGGEESEAEAEEEAEAAEPAL